MKFKGKVDEPERVIENVWYPKTQKIIAIIKNGVFETDNEDLIEQLKELGYETIEDKEEVIEEKLNDTPMAEKRVPTNIPENLNTKEDAKKKVKK